MNDSTSEGLPKTYEPQEIEAPLFTSWVSSGYFSRDNGGYADPDLPPFTIVIPPPNVTGMLHMGHALNNTLQDILIRKARMQGRPTRWIVGTDHAGIATQNKVEQKLTAEGLTRFDLGREAFVDACWQWRQEYGSTIIEQLKAMGCSCDYLDEKFTMDPDYAKAIRKVFVTWFKEGLIYRGHRIINWCPRCTTALADDEVVHQDEVGHLWHLRYPLVEPVAGQEFLIVATTRPETMLGDTGVAVNPDDQRYSALLSAGAQVRLPLTNRIIPVFADSYVDPEFGTGAVKVTPAHDPNDYEMGQRANLDTINIFDEHAVINENGGIFAGLTRDQARVAVLEALEEAGLLDHQDEHQHAVGHCYRCDATIEPWLSEQWFVAMKELAAPAIEAVKDGRVSFYPKRWQNVYFQWMENIRDWCISRQLWWGHRIPVFYCDNCGYTDALEADLENCPKCGSQLRQDEDVLDTWFSSQLWPFATYGWPAQDDFQQQLDAYYPTQVLSTARDIIFLWVARMVMSSIYFMDGQIPFSDVLIHPTVLDKNGDIMSKSRGNGIDPLDLIDEFGADGMRFGLALQVTGSQDMKFNQEKLLSSRNFCTKIWNAARYVLMKLADLQAVQGFKPTANGMRVTAQAKTAADKWILSRLAKLSAELDEGREGYDFGAVARALNHFFWNEYCDWYIEFSKSQLDDPELYSSTANNLVFVLDNALRLLHPFMPFITEKIWQSLPHGDSRPSLMVAQWPDSKELSKYIDQTAETTIDKVSDIVSAARSTRARYGISPKQQLNLVVNVLGDFAASDADNLNNQYALISDMAKAGKLLIQEQAPRPAHAAVTIEADLEIYIELEGIVDFAAERQRLEKEVAKLRDDYQKLHKKLQNQGFLKKAAPDIIQKAHADIAEITSAIERIAQQLEYLA